MATTQAGNGIVPVTRMQSLAGELRLLQSAMADMQGRLDALLAEIGAGFEHASAASETRALPEQAGDAEPPQAVEIAEIVAANAPVEVQPASETGMDLEQVDAELATTAETELPAPIAQEPELDCASDEPVIAVEMPAGEETILAAATDAEAAETIAPSVETAEAASIEAQDIAVIVEPTSETPAIAEAAETTAETPAETITLVEVPAEALATKAEVVPQTLSTNVVVLAGRRRAPRKTRTVASRVGRWAAVIALIAIVVAVAATGTGFAGNGQFLIVKDVCALAGDVCSIMPGIP